MSIGPGMKYVLKEQSNTTVRHHLATPYLIDSIQEAISICFNQINQITNTSNTLNRPELWLYNSMNVVRAGTLG